jgi:hypothetical protein
MNIAGRRTSRSFLQRAACSFNRCHPPMPRAVRRPAYFWRLGIASGCFASKSAASNPNRPLRPGIGCFNSKSAASFSNRLLRLEIGCFDSELAASTRNRLLQFGVGCFVSESAASFPRKIVRKLTDPHFCPKAGVLPCWFVLAVDQVEGDCLYAAATIGVLFILRLF